MLDWAEEYDFPHRDDRGKPHWEARDGQDHIEPPPGFSHGEVQELIDYKEKLNESLLFPNRDIAEAYVRLHDKMSVEGKEVEDIIEMTIYEVWRHKC
jgi:hypothetical protein